ELKRRVKKASPLGDSDEDTAIRNERARLGKELLSWRRTRDKLLPPDTPEFAHPEDDDWAVEREQLYLPSQYPEQKRKTLDLDQLAAKERLVREAEAEMALVELCMAIRTFGVSVSYKHAEITGQARSTRAQQQLVKALDIRNKYARVYRFHYGRLVKLGMPENDGRFQKLTDADLKSYNSTRDAQQLGSSKRSESWIWYGGMDGSSIKDDDKKRLDAMIDDDLRVFYFRTKAHYERWGEEGEILREDFKRLIKSHDAMEKVWLALS
ncbi:hypothetical protein EXIGLDRAFT_597626, partial [Exidia glandulosa HHB12029]